MLYWKYERFFHLGIQAKHQGGNFPSYVGEIKGKQTQENIYINNLNVKINMQQK